MLKCTYNTLASRLDLLPMLLRIEVEFGLFPHKLSFGDTEEEKEEIFLQFQNRGIKLAWRDKGNDSDLDSWSD